MVRQDGVPRIRTLVTQAAQPLPGSPPVMGGSHGNATHSTAIHSTATQPNTTQPNATVLVAPEPSPTPAAASPVPESADQTADQTAGATAGQNPAPGVDPVGRVRGELVAS